MKNEYYNEIYDGYITPTLTWAGNPFSRQTFQYAEMRLRHQTEGEKPPRRERGDIYVILGTIIGMIIGGVMGSLSNVLVFSLIILGGGIIGAIIGNLIKKWRCKTENARGGEGNVY